MTHLLRPDGTPIARPRDARRLDRRRLLLATAGLTGAAVFGRARPAGAWPGTTVAGEWVEATQLGFIPSGVGGEAGTEPIAFQSDFAFQGIAPHWDSSALPGAGIEISLSQDGVSWTDPTWIVESSDGGPPDRNGRRFGRMVPANWASFVRYRAFDVAGNPASLPGLTFSYFDGSNGPGLVETAQPALTPSLEPPPIISRAAWGADESLRFRDDGTEIWPIEYQTPEHIVIHHTDTTNFEDPVLGLRLIYYYHAVTRGWGDIGYNYLVDFMGNIYEGRAGGEGAVGGHAFQYNWGSTGIGLMGRYFDAPMTPEMVNGLTWITAWASRGLDPVGNTAFQDILSLPTICGHRDVNNTSCPGDLLYSDLDAVRQGVASVQAGAVGAAPPSPGFAPGDLVATAAEGGNLRDMPTTGANVLATVALGEVLTVQDGPATNDGFVWYLVRGSTLTGWIAGELLTLASDTAAPAAAPADTAAPATDIATEPPPSE